MSFIKKISRALLLLVIGLSFVSNASAQTMIKSTAAELEQINSQPEVYVRDLVLDKALYKSGDTVKGSFVLYNAKDKAVSDVNYEVVLVGDYQENTLAGVFYDGVKTGPVYLQGNESKKINFSYILPKAVAGDGLGIEVIASLSTGLQMGWKDALIKVEGSMGYLNITEGFISIDADKKFGLQVGPTVYENEKAFINLKFNNPTKENIEIIPKIRVYDRADQAGTFKDLVLAATKVLANSSSTIKYELPKFDNKPGVYVGNATFLDPSGVKRANDLEFRYIVQGPMATIKGLTVDKSNVKEGDDIKVTVSYSGTTFDIRNPDAKVSSVYDLSVKLFSESNKLIADYTKSIDFNIGNEVSFTVKSSGNSSSLRSEVVIKNAGAVLSQYKSEIPSIVKVAGGTNSDYLKIIGLILLVLILIAIAIFVFLKMKNKTPAALVILLLVLVAPMYIVKSFTVTSSGRTTGGDSPTIPSISFSSPNGSYNPGQSFYLTGSVSAQNCGNQYLQMKFAYAREGASSWTGSYEPIYTDQWTARGDTLVTRGTSNFSIGPFNAENTPGTHKISFKVDAYPYWGAAKTDQHSYAEGYQSYSVISVTPPVLSANASANCGGKINLSWNNTGANSYKVFKNGSLLTSTTSRSIETTGSSTDLFIVKSTFGSTDSASSIPAVSATPSLDCAALSATCSATPSTAMINESVTWRATPAGGPSSTYTYSWTGTDGLTGSTAAVNKSYTAIGRKYATSTITSGAETVTVGCPGSVANGGGGSGHGGGNGIEITPPIPMDGACGGSNGGVFANGTLLTNDLNRCYFTGSVSTPASFSAYGPWEWTCSGVNGSNVSSSECKAYQSEIVNSAYDCNVPTADLASPVNVNNSIGWAATPKSGSGYLTKWAFTDSNNPNPEFTTNAGVWNKTFTTTGLKTIYVKFASSTAPNVVGNTCTATTSIVQTGGSNKEI